MNWTNAQPTEPGWYWWRAPYNPALRDRVIDVVRLQREDDRLFYELDAALTFYSDTGEGLWSGGTEWYGPIPMPCRLAALERVARAARALRDWGSSSSPDGRVVIKTSSSTVDALDDALAALDGENRAGGAK